MPWLILIAALLLLIFALFILYNNRFIVRSYTVETEKPIGEKKIVLLSDLHNKVYGDGNRPLLDCIDALKPDAVISIGCVIRGDTPHFDYVCESATQGITALNVEGRAAVIFGVLTDRKSVV